MPDATPNDLITRVLARWRQKAEDMESDADAAASYGADAVAKVLRREAADARALCDEIDHELAEMSVDEWAAFNGAAPSTVRTWIKRGELAASQRANGDYIILRTAKHERVRRPGRAIGKLPSAQGESA